MSSGATKVVKEYFMGLDAPPEVKDFLDRLVDSVVDVDESAASQTQVDTISVDVAAFEAEYDAHDHSPGDPTQVAHGNTIGQTENDHHNREHDVEGASDHSTTAVEGSVLISKDATDLEMTLFLRYLKGLFGSIGKRILSEEGYADIAAALADVDTPGKTLFKGRFINIKTAGEIEQEVHCLLINRSFEIDDGETPPAAPYGWTEVP